MSFASDAVCGVPGEALVPRSRATRSLTRFFRFVVASRWGYWLWVFPFCRLYNFIRDDIPEKLSTLVCADICGKLLWRCRRPDVSENLIYGCEGPTFRKIEILP